MTKEPTNWTSVFLDCQTTGASPPHSELLEIAWNQKSFLLRQSRDVPKKILQMTGIRAEEIQNGFEASDIAGKLKNELESATNPVVICHFARFEKIYLDRLWREFYRGPFPAPILCTHNLTKRLLPNLPGHSLKAVSGWVGGGHLSHKRALDHVAATELIWNALSPLLSERGIIDIAEILAFQNAAPETSKKSANKHTFKITREQRQSIPKAPGIYRYLNAKGQLLYVGKATSLRHRVTSYFTGGCRRDYRKREMLAQVDHFEVETHLSPLHAALRECELIQELKPPYNIALKSAARDERRFMALLKSAPDELLSQSFASNLIKESFYGITCPGTLKEGIEIWRAQHGLPSEGPVAERTIDLIGIPLFKQWVARKKAELEAKKSARSLISGPSDTEPADDKSEEDPEDLEFTWTPELIAEQCDRIARRSLHAHLRTRWIHRLADADFQVVDPKFGVFSISTNALISQTHLKVFLSELRRVETAGGQYKITKPWDMRIPFWV